MFVQVYVSPAPLYDQTSGRDMDGHGPVGGGVAREHSSEWMEVPVGGERAFDFTTKGKRRHGVRT